MDQKACRVDAGRVWLDDQRQPGLMLMQVMYCKTKSDMNRLRQDLSRLRLRQTGFCILSCENTLFSLGIFDFFSAIDSSLLVIKLMGPLTKVSRSFKPLLPSCRLEASVMLKFSRAGPCKLDSIVGSSTAALRLQRAESDRLHTEACPLTGGVYIWSTL